MAHQNLSESRIAGVDEAGRGPLAGPVVTAAVILPQGFEDPLVCDSKALSPKKRELAFSLIKEIAVAYKIVAVGPKRIDKLNILQASLWGMAKAAEALGPTLILVDGNKQIPTFIEQKTIIGGDKLVPCISAASILAKVTRDRLMERLDKKFPEYGFAKHFGYPTKAHKEALYKFGRSAIHRESFRF